MLFRTLLPIAVLTAIAPAFAQEDLTLPPEFRSQAPKLPQDAPSLDSKHQGPAQAKRTLVQKETAAPARNADSAAASAKHADDDRLSFGMSWKANNTTEAATRATSGLSGDNKNHPDEAAGAGGLLGLKYKF
jgi:hypothetical protein